MGAPLDKMEPDGENKRKQPFDLIGFREPNHKGMPTIVNPPPPHTVDQL